MANTPPPQGNGQQPARAQQQQKNSHSVTKREPQNSIAKRIDPNPLLMTPEHWTRLKEIATAAAGSGLLPKGVDTPQKAFVIAVKGNELGFSPMYALERLSVVNGKACIDGQAMLRLIYERAPGATVDFLTPPEKEATECEIEMRRPGGNPKRFRFTLEDAKRAELLGKDPWKKYPRAMLRWRCVAEGARIMFPDIIAGLYLHEEMGREVDDIGAPIEVEYRRMENAGPKPVEPVPPTPAKTSEELGWASTDHQKQGMRLLFDTAKACEWGKEDLFKHLKENFAIESAAALTAKQLQEAIVFVEANKKELAPDVSAFLEQEKGNELPPNV